MTSADIRSRLTQALRLDLIEPEPDEPQAAEILSIPPSRFYLTGFLAPWNAPAAQKADDDEQGELEMAAAGGGAEDEDSTAEPPAARRRQFPSSIGVSVLAPPGDSLSTGTTRANVNGSTRVWTSFATAEHEPLTHLIRRVYPYRMYVETP